MIEQLPTPIEPQEIKVGDRVRIQFDKGAQEGIARVIGTDHIVINYNMGRVVAHGFTDGDWFLISRPTPPREPGTLWEDPETSHRYVRTGGTEPDHTHYQTYLDDGQSPTYDTLAPLYSRDRDVIARLIPVEPPEAAEMRRKLTAQATSIVAPEGSYADGVRDGLLRAVNIVKPQS